MLKRNNYLFALILIMALVSPVSAQAQNLDFKGAFGFDNFQFFGSTFLTVIFVIIICVFILLLVIVFVVLWLNAKKYKYRIPLYSKVGNVPTKIGVFKAKPVPFGRAGDQLWHVKGRGLKKWIAPASLQSAKNEFWHWLREDGEWVNFSMKDLDEISKQAGVQYVKQEARLTRLAIDRLLEQRLSNKGFWEKWGLVIGYVIFFLVITIALVIFFHQYGKIVESTGSLMAQADQILKEANLAKGGKGGLSGLIPANATISLLPLFIRRRYVNHK